MPELGTYGSVGALGEQSPGATRQRGLRAVSVERREGREGWGRMGGALNGGWGRWRALGSRVREPAAGTNGSVGGPRGRRGHTSALPLPVASGSWAVPALCYAPNSSPCLCRLLGGGSSAPSLRRTARLLKYGGSRAADRGGASVGSPR